MGFSPKYPNITPKLHPQVGCLGEKNAQRTHEKNKREMPNRKADTKAHMRVGIHEVICVFPGKRGIISQADRKGLCSIQQRENITTREKISKE